MSRQALAAGLAPEAVGRARWSGLAATDVVSVVRVEGFDFGDGSGLELIEAAAVDGTRTRLTLPSDDPLLAAAPGPWPALHRLATEGGSVTGDAGGRLVGIPGPAAARATGREIRRSAADQSHTSVIVGDSILKLYRRLPDGPNPEVELLSALASRADPAPPVPPLRGSVEHRPAAGRPAVGLAGAAPVPVVLVQALVPQARDAFEAIADELAGALVDAAGARAGAVGLVAPEATALAGEAGAALARLHASLAAVEQPGFRPRAATAAERDAWLVRARRRVGEAAEALADGAPDVAARLADAEAAITADLAPLADPGLDVTVQRLHGDLHLGQVLATPGGVLFVDFEGDPLRDPAERLEPGPPVRDVASLTRSIDHVARSGHRRAREALGREPGPVADAALEAWIAAARRACLDAYRDTSPGPGLEPVLLRAFELEKAMLELRYAAGYLPAWLYAPVAALRRLLVDA